MLEFLLPPDVVGVERFHDGPDGDLFDAEREAVATAVPARRHEFATVRACAREALQRLGQPPVAIVPGEHGRPGWPVGFVGSMTHCPGYRAAAVARSGSIRSIGIDSEPHEHLDVELLAKIARPEEVLRLDALASADATAQWPRLLFSAKESIYKAWNPLARSWLGFDDASVSIDVSGWFTANLLVSGPLVDGAPLTAMRGRWMIESDLILTAIVLTC